MSEMTRSVADRWIPGGWTRRRVPVAEHVFDLLLPADPDELLNHLETVGEAEDPVHDPYWAALWPSAIVMAQWILARRWPPATRTLELGCGTGLVGLAGLAAGLDVTFSDHVPTAVDLALENASRNGFPHAAGRLFTWKVPPQDHYPLILACDVLYDSAQHDGLLSALDRLLTAEGQCWIGDPERSAALQWVKRAERQGFRVTEEQQAAALGRTAGIPFRLLKLVRGRGQHEAAGEARNGFE